MLVANWSFPNSVISSTFISWYFPVKMSFHFSASVTLYFFFWISYGLMHFKNVICHNPLASFCAETLTFPRFYHRRHFKPDPVSFRHDFINLWALAAFCHRLGVIHHVVFVFVFTRYYLPYLPYSFLASDLESTASPKKLWFLLMGIIIKKSKPVYLVCCLLHGCHCYCGVLNSVPLHNQQISIYMHVHTYSFYYCVLSYRNLSTLKHLPFIISQIPWNFRCPGISPVSLTSL